MERDLSRSNKWNPIVTAPSDIDLELCVYDSGEFHALAFPCRRNGVGWSDVRRNKMVLIRPTDAVRNVVGIRCGAISSNMKVSFQAARSMG